MPRRDLREASMFNNKTGFCYCLLTLTILQPRVGICCMKLSLLDGENFPMPANATQESFLRLFNFGSRPDADKPSFSGHQRSSASGLFVCRSDHRVPGNMQGFGRRGESWKSILHHRSINPRHQYSPFTQVTLVSETFTLPSQVI